MKLKNRFFFSREELFRLDAAVLLNLLHPIQCIKLVVVPDLTARWR